MLFVRYAHKLRLNQFSQMRLTAGAVDTKFGAFGPFTTWLERSGSLLSSFLIESDVKKVFASASTF
jgi:hypothetical protein